jgi:lipopolysaccharide/colanic/teichoic acid biosynthesis glycosyltransferase
MSKIYKIFFFTINVIVFYFIGNFLFLSTNNISYIIFSFVFSSFIYIFRGFEKEKVRLKYDFFLVYLLSFSISALIHVFFQLLYTHDLSYKSLFFLLLYSILILPLGVLYFYNKLISSYNEYNILVIGEIDYCTSYMKILERFFFHRIKNKYFFEVMDSISLNTEFLKEKNINLLIAQVPNDFLYRLSKVFQLNTVSIGKVSEEFMRKIPIEIIRVNESFYILSFEDKGFDPIVRILDVLISLLIFICAAPVLLISIFFIILMDSTDVIYKQERIGYLGIKFNMYKLTTMKLDLKTGNFFVTGLGNILRKLRINELPQLLNVLRGEMSLVGPRPDLGYEYDFFEKEIPYYHYRLNTLPGITGHAQVYYDYVEILNKEDTIKRLEFDLYYVKNYSVYLYMMTILKTIGTILFIKGK